MSSLVCSSNEKKEKKKDVIVPTITTSVGQTDVNPRFSRILRSYPCLEAFPFGWFLDACRSSISPENRTKRLDIEQCQSWPCVNYD